ncbi:protein kinase family protein [Mycobacterium mantenii]|uniref:protein kinase family protein n=1 Tax=Mycobacterium mantenii TaxID=560555 RepID=UPI000A5CD6DB|nr:protein kinase family protein [Mycobacterium mantenii]
MARAAIERSRLGQLTKIGQGGQGVVYRAPKVSTRFSDHLVFKNYKSQARDEIDFSALAAMPDLVESMVYEDGERLISMAAWPCAIVEDSGTPTGFVMPEIPEKFFISLTTLKGKSLNPAEFQHLLNPQAVLYARGISIDDEQRYTLLREVAAGLTFLHSNGVCVGDISPKNLLFSLEPPLTVYFIDCDAMRINEVSALPQVETPGWEVPPGEDLATVFSDTYKLGLLALRLLVGDQDIKSAQGIPSTTPNALRKLIADTLNRPPDKRPLPETWIYVLGNAIEEAQHHKKSAPKPTVPPAAKAAPPPTPPSPPADSQASGPSPTAKIWAGVAGVAFAIIAILGIIITRSAGNSASEPSAYRGSTTSPTTSSEYGATSTYLPSPTTTVPAVTFSTPPYLLSGPDLGGDSRCAGGGYPLANNYRVGPAASSGSGPYTSCGFAIAVGESYLAALPSDYRYSTRVTAPSPSAGCLQVRADNPSANIQCDGNQFVMECQMVGTDQWVTCRGGHNATVYIF